MELKEAFNQINRYQRHSYWAEGQTVADALSGFWDKEKSKAIAEICATEKLEPASFMYMIEQYHFSGKKPLQGDIVKALKEKPRILERKSVVERISAKLLKLVSTFDEGLGGL